MSILKKLAITGIRFSGIPYLLRHSIQKEKTTILMFHRPSATHFNIAVNNLKKRYNIISFEQYLNAISGEDNTLPNHSLILTFDDGWISNYSLLPVIEKHQIPITIFLMAGIADTNRHPWFTVIADKQLKREIKTMSDSGKTARLKHKGFEETKEYPQRLTLNQKEIQTMQNSGLVTFGSHALFHPILPRCSDAKAAKEITLSRQIIENLTCQPCSVFSFPNGEYSERDIRLCKKAGYRAAVTLDVGYNNAHSDPFRLKRISTPDKGSLSEIIVKVSGLWAGIKVVLGKQKGRLRHGGL